MHKEKIAENFKRFASFAAYRVRETANTVPNKSIT